MEVQLKDRLAKLIGKPPVPISKEGTLILITLSTLEAIRSHQCECHPERDGEELALADAIEIVKDYR